MEEPTAVTVQGDVNGVPLLLWGWDGAFIPLWVYTESGDRLHAVYRLNDEYDDDWTSGRGRTTCGRNGYLYYPGVFSRLSMPRCAHCCRMLRIPRGVGHPKNDPALRELFGMSPA